MCIGKKIKQLRQRHGLTQEELAIRCDLSCGFISQVERDLTSTSITTLEAILTALGETLPSFFQDEKKEVIIASRHDVCNKVFESLGYSIDWIIPNAQNLTMEPIIVNIDAGGQTILANPHYGEEFGYVIKGQITLALNQAHYKIKQGESFYFTPNKDHYLKNDSDGPAQVLWVSSPPNF